MKNSLVYIALCLIFFSASFTFNLSEVKWLWADHPQVPIILLSTAVICLGIYFYGKHREIKTRN